MPLARNHAWRIASTRSMAPSWCPSPPLLPPFPLSVARARSWRPGLNGAATRPQAQRSAAAGRRVVPAAPFWAGPRQHRAGTTRSRGQTGAFGERGIFPVTVKIPRVAFGEGHSIPPISRIAATAPSWVRGILFGLFGLFSLVQVVGCNKNDTLEERTTKKNHNYFQKVPSVLCPPSPTNTHTTQQFKLSFSLLPRTITQLSNHYQLLDLQ